MSKSKERLTSAEEESTFEEARRKGEKAVADFIAFGKINDRDIARVCRLVEDWKKPSAVGQFITKILASKDSPLPDSRANILFELLEGGVTNLHERGETMLTLMNEQREAVQERISETARVAYEIADQPFVTVAVEQVKSFFISHRQEAE